MRVFYKIVIKREKLNYGSDLQGQEGSLPWQEVIFQTRVRVFHRGFQHEKTDESTRP